MLVESQGRCYRMRSLRADYQLGQEALRRRAGKALAQYPLSRKEREALGHNCALVAYGLGRPVRWLLRRMTLEEIARLAWDYREAQKEVSL